MSTLKIVEPAEPIVGEVQKRYAKIATGEIAGCGCGNGCATAESDLSQQLGYSAAELAALPAGANLGLGCGAPLAHLAPAPGETVLDLGSGAGIDAFLAAQRVGATGKVIGVDMTPEMIAKARAGAERAGFTQVEFRQGRLEALPVEDATVDAVTSNCVINLVPDKSAVFREITRVLKPGGRLVVSDILLDRPLPAAIANDVLAYVGCVAGAELRETYFGRLRDAGLAEVEILRDDDYLDALLAAAPVEIEVLSQRTGVGIDEVQGVVRSITYRARRPQS